MGMCRDWLRKADVLVCPFCGERYGYRDDHMMKDRRLCPNCGMEIGSGVTDDKT